jgi:hypothetical protein
VKKLLCSSSNHKISVVFLVANFSHFLRKIFRKRISVTNSLFCLEKNPNRQKSPQWLACMMKGFSELAGSQSLDHSFGGATWSPAGLWRRQLELPSVSFWV